MTPAERVALSEKLGEEGLAAFMSVITRAERLDVGGAWRRISTATK